MAESNKPTPKPAPRRTPTPDELRARATGAGAPPPAAAALRKPLPVGRPVELRGGGGPREVSLTELERRQLRAAGWRDGDPIPASMADILARVRDEMGQVQAAARAEATHDLPLPVDPSTPPLRVDTVDINSLPPDQRARINREVQEALQRERDAKAQRQAGARLARLPASVQQAAAAAEAASPGLRLPPPQEPLLDVDLEAADDLDLYEKAQAALPPAEKFTAQPARPARPAPAPTRPDLGGAPSVPAQIQGQFDDMLRADGVAPAAPEEPPPAAPAPAPAPEPEPAGELGAQAAMTHCPHCDWPLDVADVPQPDQYEKMAFLHSVLGQKSFAKDYELFGGAVRLTCRALTTQEIDACYAVALEDRQAGVVQTPADFFERINRLRLSLQLLSLASAEFRHDLPDGLSRDTNPAASAFWQDMNMPAPAGPSDKGLRHVENWVFSKVLRTESLARVVTMVCNRFNRLVGRLEALVDNSDFWRATGAPF